MVGNVESSLRSLETKAHRIEIGSPPTSTGDQIRQLARLVKDLAQITRAVAESHRF